MYVLFLSALPSCNDDDPTGPADFIIANGDVNLSARLWLPGAATYPVIIIVEGTASSRKENFESRAEFFIENGMAVLTYEKRGYFNSTGTRVVPTVANSPETFALLSSDLLAAVEFLKTSRHIDPTRIGLICSDLGVWIGTLAQAHSSDIYCAVNLVGAATSVGVKEYYASLSGNDPSGNNLSQHSAAQIDSLVALYTGPQGFDPLPSLKQLTQPQLWLMGGQDFLYPTRQSVAILNDLITTHRKKIDIVVEYNANHALYDIVERERLLQGDLLASWLGEQFFLTHE